MADGMMLDVGCWMLDVGCWMLDVGCWMLDVGCSMLDVRCSLSEFRVRSDRLYCGGKAQRRHRFVAPESAIAAPHYRRPTKFHPHRIRHSNS